MDLQRTDVEQLYEAVARQPAAISEAQLVRRTSLANRKAILSGLIVLITVLAAAVTYFGVDRNQRGFESSLCNFDCQNTKNVIDGNNQLMNESDIINTLQLNETARVHDIY